VTDVITNLIFIGAVALIIVLGTIAVIAFGTWFEAWINTRYYKDVDDDKEHP